MIDFGFTAVLPASSLRPLTAELHVLPAFATRCRLGGVMPAGDVTKWSITAKEFFVKMLDDQTLFIAMPPEVSHCRRIALSCHTGRGGDRYDDCVCMLVYMHVQCVSVSSNILMPCI